MVLGPELVVKVRMKEVIVGRFVIVRPLPFSYQEF